MKIGICDDNVLHLKHLENLVYKFFSNKEDIIIDTIRPEDLSSQIESMTISCDIYIMDIEMGEFNGIELAKGINHIKESCIIIFISSYIYYASDVYDADHIYFILKAEAEDRLPIALEKALRVFEDKTSKFFIIKNHNVETLIPLLDIIYIEAMGRYLYIHELNNTHKYTGSLKTLVSELPEYFVRCHHSYLVNLNYISSLSRISCELRSGISIPISYTYSKAFKHSFTIFASKYF